MQDSRKGGQDFKIDPQTQDDYFDFSKLTNENFWQEILHHSLQAFVYTIRKFWYLFILTSIAGIIIAEVIYSMQVDKYHLNMTLRYGSIKNGLSKLSMGGGSIGVGSDMKGLGAVESFGKNFVGIPTPQGTSNNFGLNLKDFLIIIRGKFVSPENFKEKFKSKKARITSFDAKKSSSLASLTATGAVRKEVLSKAKELSDYLENLFLERKRSIIEKIDERLKFTREEYFLISRQIKHINKLEKEFGRTTEIMARKNTLLTQELSVRASLSEILSFKGEYYIKDFEILNVSISPSPRKFLGRSSILFSVLFATTILTSLSVILLVFYRLKNITQGALQTEESAADNMVATEQQVSEKKFGKKSSSSSLNNNDRQKVSKSNSGKKNNNRQEKTQNKNNDQHEKIQIKNKDDNKKINEKKNESDIKNVGEVEKNKNSKKVQGTFFPTKKTKKGKD